MKLGKCCNHSENMHQYFNYHNLQIAYTKQGMGNVVVLLHGFGEDGSIWNYQVEYLKDFFTVIVIDLPGSGKSKIDSWVLMVDGSENVDALYTIEFYADCAYALLQKLCIANYTLLGHSFGGYVTLAFAEKYSNILNGFGLIHSTAFADNDQKKANRQRSIELMAEYGSYQ